jgi:hypothetical protein
VPLLQTSFAALEARAAAPADKRVMAAVWRVFRAMAADPAVPPPPVDGGKVSASQAPAVAAVAARTDVSPRELRAALVGLSSIHVDPSDMHDAGEVFAEILGMLHRAEVGKPPVPSTPLGGGPSLPSSSTSKGGMASSSSASASTDLLLPRKVKVAAPRPPLVEGGSPPTAPSPYAAALLSGVAAATAAATVVDRPATLVHRVFGLDVQVGQACVCPWIGL